jgi:hypothetical protein
MSFKHTLRSFQQTLARLAIVGLVCAALPAPALAWGEEGHHIVAMIAEKHLSDQARQEINNIMEGQAVCGLGASDPVADKMVCVSKWADTSRNSTHKHTYNWHFVDITLKRETYDETKDCEPKDQATKGKCGLYGLEHARRILRGEITDPQISRAQALMFVIHIVGDLHQPLHTVKEQVGGNLFFVTYFNIPSQLHKVWDDKILESRMMNLGKTESEYASLLNEQISQADEESYTQGDPISWLNECHALAINKAYAPLKGSGPGKPALGETYYKASWPIINGQLQRGGVRLAKILKDDLG